MSLANALPALLLATAAPAIVALQDAPTLDGTEYARASIHQRIIIRIPRIARIVRTPAGNTRFAPPPPSVEWKEDKAPRCIALATLAGATVTRGGDVDLILVDGKRVRAKLGDDCPALDFYSGFYLKPATDGMICGKRDVIRARSGGSCPIERFRKLVVKR